MRKFLSAIWWYMSGGIIRDWIEIQRILNKSLIDLIVNKGKNHNA